MSTLRTIFGEPAVVRAHNLLTSGNGRGSPHWSSGNVYHEDARGRPVYDWSQVDPVFDVWVDNDMVPLVELGFCPVQLSRPSARALYETPSSLDEYENLGWASPPRDIRRWESLVEAVVDHLARRYGTQRASGWYWELWNEPDIGYWQGSVEEYCRLYDVTVAAARRALPGALVGGPATTDRGTEFLARFLEHCLGEGHGDGRKAPGAPDFVSFHTKGAPQFPRTYGPIGSDGAAGDENRSPSTEKMLRDIKVNLDIVRSYPALAGTPVFVDECDPGVPSHMGIFDNRNYGFRNTEYYAVFQLQLMAALLEDGPAGHRGVSLATAWAWYMEGDRYFEGTRSFFTASDIPLPVTNAYRMLAMLGTGVLGHWVEQSPEDAPTPGLVGALPTVRADGGVVAIVWHHNDDQYVRGTSRVGVDFSGLPCTGRPVKLREYLVDSQHSNSHTAWLELGSSQYPSATDIDTIRGRSSLEMIREETLDDCPGSLRREVELQCPAAVLIEIVPV
jgi:xylan 1,4-beta-xylosidase